MDIEEKMEWLATPYVNIIKENKNAKNPAPQTNTEQPFILTKFTPFKFT